VPLIFVSTLTVLAMALIESQLFLFVEDQFRWSLQKASLGFAYVGVVMVFTQGFLIRRLLPVWGERRLLLTGAFFSLAAFACMSQSVMVWQMAVAVTLLGLGVGMVNPAAQGSISLLAGKDEQGEVLGLSQGFSALARVLGPLMGGFAYKTWGIHSPFVFSACLVAVAVISIIILYRAIPSKADQRENHV
jgi:MFS family permease